MIQSVGIDYVNQQSTFKVPDPYNTTQINPDENKELIPIKKKGNIKISSNTMFKKISNPEFKRSCPKRTERNTIVQKPKRGNLMK